MKSFFKHKRGRSFTRALFLIITLSLSLVLCGTAAYASSYECGVYFEIDKNPIESVEITADHGMELTCGESVMLSAVVYPVNARETVVEERYRITDGSGYAEIKGDRLTVKRDAPVGAVIEVVAEVDGVVSDGGLRFTVAGTPVSRIELLNTEEMLSVGSALKLETAIYPESATDKRVNYSIVSDTPYMTVSYSGVLSFWGGVVPEGELSVTVRAASASDPSVFVEKTFDIYRPAVTVTDSDESISSVHQQCAYSFDTELPYLAEIFGSRGVRYSVNVDESVAVIDIKGLLYVSPTAPIGTEIIVDIVSVDGESEYTVTLTVEPVYATDFTPVILTEPDVCFPEGGFYLPGSVIAFDVAAFMPVNVTEANKVFALRVSDESLAFVVGNTVVIRDTAEITARDPKFTVTVYSEPNGLEAEFEIGLYIPVTSVTASPKPVRVTEGGRYQVTDLIDHITDPLNGSVRSVAYLAEGLASDIATLKDGVLTVNGDLPAGEIVIRLRVEVNGIRSNTVELSVYKPAHSLEIKAETERGEITETSLPASSSGYADTVTVTVWVDGKASECSPRLVVSSGAEYIDGGTRFVGYADDGAAVFEFELRKGLKANSVTPVIRFYATQDGVVSDEIITVVYIPNEDIFIADQTVDRGGAILLQPTLTPNCTSKQWELKLSAEAEAMGVRLVGGNNVVVPKATAGGTRITLLYRALESDAVWQSEQWKTLTCTVNGLTDVYADIYKGTYKQGFNIVYGNDSAGHVINPSAPQIMAGRSLDIQIRYGVLGESITDYGVIVPKPEDGSYNIIYDCGDYSLVWVDYDTVRIVVSEDASGDLSFTAEVAPHDNLTYYLLNLGTFSVFRPLNGTLKLKTMTENGQNITSLYNRSSGNFDFEATALSQLKFQFLESGISVSSTGVVRITSLDISASQTVQYSCAEYYNNVLYREYKATTTLNIRTVRLEKNGGDGGYDTIVAVKGLVGVSGSASKIAPSKTGYTFGGFSSFIDADCKVVSDYSHLTAIGASWSINYYKVNIKENNTNVTVKIKDTSTEIGNGDTVAYGTQLSISVSANDGYKDAWVDPSGTYTMPASDITVSSGATKKCVATGTMIALADGTQKAVEELDGSETLLVWDFVNGCFSAAPILFIDSHGDDIYTVTHLYFEDGTVVDMIDDHGFWDVTLNRFVYITDENAAEYVGHYFNKCVADENGGLTYTAVRLVDAVNEQTYTGAFSPITYGAICYYVDGMLSMPGATEGFTNYFEVDADTMTYDARAMQADIELYGLFTYEDFAGEVPAVIFDAFNGQYLKISIAKGLITEEQIASLITVYSEFFESEGEVEI